MQKSNQQDSHNLYLNSNDCIAITGATGMVGSFLAGHLAKFCRLRLLVRKESNLSLLADIAKLPNIEIIYGDINQTDSLGILLNGASHCVHAAGYIDPFASRESIFYVNVEGTKNVFASAASNKVKQFIHISSLSVITQNHDMYNLNEEAVYAKTQEAYASSKIAAELYLLENMRLESSHLPVTILRPGFIYGPNERAWLPKVIESIRSRNAILIDKGLKQCNLISIDNLVHAIMLTINNKQAYNQIFNLTDKEYISKARLFNTIANVLDLPQIEKSIPSALLFPLTEIVSTIAPILPVNMQRKLSKLSRASYRLIALNQGFSITKAETLLGYKPEDNFENSIKRYLAPNKELALWSAN